MRADAKKQQMLCLEEFYCSCKQLLGFFYLLTIGAVRAYLYMMGCSGRGTIDGGGRRGLLE